MSSAAPVVVVAGPTASGKSGLALVLAERFGGAIVNADALQVYRDLSILTARPGADALGRAPHHLYGILEGTDRCTAGRWRAMALDAIARIREGGRVPIVAGGTGLYLRALLRGLAPIPRIPDTVREATRRRLDEVGPEAFHRGLAQRDPETAARLSPSDRQRMVRAWEIVEHTGRTQSDWLAGDAGAPPVGLRFATVLLAPERADLFAACDRRYGDMIRSGGIEEARALAARGLPADAPVMKAVGVPPLLAHLAGELSLDEARDRGGRDTRQYAKRQTTWFRNQMTPDLVVSAQLSESKQERIFSFISDFLLTASP